MEQKQPRKLKRVVIKEEFVALTGKIHEAIVLNQMIYWSERVKDTDKFIQEELNRARKFGDGSEESLEEIKETLKSGWIYKTSEEMIEETMLDISRKSMDRIFNRLVENGWLDRRKNPKYKWDKTWQYRVNLNKIQNDLLKLGYTLEGYSIPEEAISSNGQNDHSDGQIDQSNGQIVQSNGHDDQSKGQNDHSNGQIDQSNGHGDHAIPEITTEITTDINTEINNNNLSITEDAIQKLNLPKIIQKQLIKKIDRLIDDQIDIEEIELLYHATKDKVNEYQFSQALLTVLENTKEPIKNASNLLLTAIKNNLEQLNKTDKITQNENSLPKHMLNDNEKQSEPVNQDDFEIKKKELEERLKKYGN